MRRIIGANEPGEGWKDMTLRSRSVRPMILGILSITGLLGIRALARRGRRPTAERLMEMSDADFASWIHKSGLKTVTTAGLLQREGNAD